MDRLTWNIRQLWWGVQWQSGLCCIFCLITLIRKLKTKEGTKGSKEKGNLWRGSKLVSVWQFRASTSGYQRENDFSQSWLNNFWSNEGWQEQDKAKFLRQSMLQGLCEEKTGKKNPFEMWMFQWAPGNIDEKILPSSLSGWVFEGREKYFLRTPWLCMWVYRNLSHIPMYNAKSHRYFFVLV